MNDDKIEGIGGSFLIGLTILVAISSILYFIISGINSGSLSVLSFGTVMFSILVSGIILAMIFSKRTYEIVQVSKFSSSSFGFVVGFIIYATINSLTLGRFSIFALPQNGVYTTIIGSLPQIIQFLSNSIIIPIAEEIFWGIGLAVAILQLLKIAGKNYEFLNNKIVQFVIIWIIGSVSFALFHTGKGDTIFVISAIIFRSAMYFAVIGDKTFDWLKKVSIPFMFGVGAHIGNNWAFYGISKGFNLMMQEISNGWVIIFLIYLIIILGGAINFAGMIFKKKGVNT